MSEPVSPETRVQRPEMDNWLRIKRVFADCQDLPPSERGARLEAACAGEPELRREVESLLASYEKSGDFLEQPAVVVSDEVAPGTRLGHYEVLNRIAVGGMGEVYRARDVRLDRVVALKTLPPSARDADARHRFELEARTISRLNHPNICALFDIGGHGCVDFLVMEFLDGETLASRLDRGPLSQEELVRYALQIADALDSAHHQGVIHRDLKPSNIMLTETGAKLLDFGVAKLHDLEVDAGGGFGTVAYMSPEQANGEPIDARSDLFSFGAVLYEMAVGRRPFPGNDPDEVLASIRGGNVVAVATASSAIDSRLARIITKALEPSRENRYQSAAELQRDLQRAQHPSPVATFRGVAIAAGALALAGLLLVWNRITPAPPVRVGSVAVLPFKPLVPGNGAEENYIGVALADALVTELGAVAGVAVRPVTAGSRYAAALDVADAGRELNADLVVDGGVQRSGDRLQVSVRLVRAADGVIVWSDRFDSAWSDVFRVQDAIAEQVTRALAITRTGEDRQRVLRRRTGNLDAYDDYLKGRYFWSMRTAEGLQRALGYFQHAIDRDASYGPAYAGLADTYALLGSLAVSALPPREAGQKAIDAASKALQLDETLAEAHVSFAFAIYSFQWDWDLAEQHFQRAIELDPDYPTAYHWYALYLGQRGRVDEAVAEAQHGLRLEPLSHVGIYAVGLAHYQARRFDLARDYANRLLEVAPEFPHGSRLLAAVEIAEGHYDAAIALQERLHLSHPGSSLYAAGLAHAYGIAGRTDRALKILDDLKGASATRYVSSANLAIGYIGLGDRDAAFAFLEKGYTERSQALTFLKIDPIYDPLRFDPRFADLLKRVGLADQPGPPTVRAR